MKTMRVRITPMHKSPPRAGLAALNDVPLCPLYAQMLEQALRSSTGPAWWRRRKEIETREILALAQISGRAMVPEIDLTESIRVIVHGQFPAPRLPEGSDNIEIAHEVILAIRYPEKAVLDPQPGFSFVQIMYPDRIWLANVSPGHIQPLCLGATIPAAIPLRELLIMSYGALSMQTFMFDERDSAGVLNAPAARWWQRNPNLIPLSKEPFLRHAAQA